MTNLNEPDEVIEDLPEVKDGEEDKTDWKALAQKNQGIAKRYQTRNTKLKEDLVEANKPKPKKVVKEPKPKAKKDTGNLDYAQKAFLISNGIKGKDEHQLAIDTMKNSGKDLDEVIESKFFMSELKSLREKKELEAATPPSSERSPTSSPKTEVGYWIAKGELPPADQPELRQKVVNAKMKAQTDGNPFTANPVVGKATNRIGKPEIK